MARPKLYTINEKYFENIDTQNKAYILGFIYADGHVNERGFNFVIQSIDVEILNFIKEEMNLGHPIREKIIKGNSYVRLCVSNKKTATILRQTHGIPSNKSKNNIKLPDISEKLMPHFLRGLFDGDGSIWSSKSKTGCKEYAFSFCGGESIVKEIQLILKNLGINSGIRYRYGEKNKNSCSVESKGSVKLAKFYDYIYNNAHFFLKRKHDKLLKAKKAGLLHKSKMLSTNGNAEKILKLYKDGVSQKDIHVELGIPFSTVRGFIGRQRKKGLIV